MEDVRREPETVSVLFTAQPHAHKIREFESLVHAPIGQPAKQGDARLAFQNGTWKVTKHAIAVAKQATQVNSEQTGQPTMALGHDLPIKPPIKTVKHGKHRKPAREDQ